MGSILENPLGRDPREALCRLLPYSAAPFEMHEAKNEFACKGQELDSPYLHQLKKPDRIGLISF